MMLGLWLSSLPDLSRKQVEVAVALANRYPDVIQAVVVGNEVLLRGEMSAPALAETIRQVKARVPMPVTYADVWEFWLRNRDLAAAVDFITIHILPYWEDFPVPARDAARHVDAIRKQVAAAFPDKEIFLGEFGWPSAGRMREGALPSRVNQARTLHEVLAQARRDNYRVNVIEAYDQPWKRQLEGTVGGHWGLFDAYQRRAKFIWGSASPTIPAGAGRPPSVLRWRRSPSVSRGLRRVVALCRRDCGCGLPSGSMVSGTLAGLTIENVVLESLTRGDWLRSLAWAAAACPLQLSPRPAWLPEFASRVSCAFSAVRCSVRVDALNAYSASFSCYWSCSHCSPRSVWSSNRATGTFRLRRYWGRASRC